MKVEIVISKSMVFGFWFSALIEFLCLSIFGLAGDPKTEDQSPKTYLDLYP